MTVSTLNNLNTKNMRRRGPVGIWTLNHLAQQALPLAMYAFE
jgi:hypothetical protein